MGEEKELIDMKSIPIDRRDNIGVQDMDNYINGGLTVESKEVNGALVYVPYGIWCNIFNAIDTGTILYKQEIEEIERLKNKLSKSEKYFKGKEHMIEPLLQGYDERIAELREKMLILENILPLVNEV